jgi:cobalamin biosynthesis protein CobT
MGTTARARARSNVMNHGSRGGGSVRGTDVDNDNDGSRDDDNVSDDEDDGSGDDDETDDADGHDNGEDCDDEDVKGGSEAEQMQVAQDAAVAAAAVAAAQNGQPPPKFLFSVLKAFARRNGVPYEVQSDICRRHTLTMAEIMNPNVPFPIPFTFALINFMKDEIRDQRIALPLRGTCGCHACQLRTPIFCAFSNVVSDFQ